MRKIFNFSVFPVLSGIDLPLIYCARASFALSSDENILTLLSIEKPEFFQDNRFPAKSLFISLFSSKCLIQVRRNNSVISFVLDTGRQAKLPSSSKPPSHKSPCQCRFHLAKSPAVWQESIMLVLISLPDISL
jgi:hypothetical protein